ncbi:MAG: MBL fold metallo-hydrolase [Eubacteriales bacterium]|nr:MBL fold metallo-hydrolase [Eubacteriales bacterium]
MKLQYLGTAAAEALPALFCNCATCTTARARGGKNIRGRSGMVLDGSLMIDFPPDIYMHSLNLGLNLNHIQDIIVTHSHMDHFDALELTTASPDYYAHNGENSHPIHVYGNGNVGRALQAGILGEFGHPVDFLPYHRVWAYRPFAVQDFTVTALPALHALGDATEDAFIYLIQKAGKSLLYANDTGIFYDDVFEYLKKVGVKLDMVSFDCTFGTLPDGKNHMGLPDNLVVQRRLEEQRSAGVNTRYVVTHFSHNCGSCHEELVEAAAQYGYTVAYDGMCWEI